MAEGRASGWEHEQASERAGERARREDAALLEAWRLGDRRAGNLLFERHYASVAGCFRDQVPDAVQEALIRATFLGGLTDEANLRAHASLRTSLLAIAHHVLTAGAAGSAR